MCAITIVVDYVSMTNVLCAKSYLWHCQTLSSIFNSDLFFFYSSFLPPPAITSGPSTLTPGLSITPCLVHFLNATIAPPFFWLQMLPRGSMFCYTPTNSAYVNTFHMILAHLCKFVACYKLHRNEDTVNVGACLLLSVDMLQHFTWIIDIIWLYYTKCGL